MKLGMVDFSKLGIALWSRLRDGLVVVTLLSGFALTAKATVWAVSQPVDANQNVPSIHLFLPVLAVPPPPCEVIIPACNVTNTLDTWENQPEWSPDGSKLVFVRHASTPESVADAGIYIVNADGSRQGMLAGDGVNEPTWSPDGSKIAFSYGAIFVMNADGSQRIGLTDLDFPHETSPVWSPDGKQIAYQSFSIFDLCCDFAPDLYVMNADGSHQTKVASNVTLAPPTWSPDSSKIAGVIYHDGTSRLYVMDANGSNLIYLTNNNLDENGMIDLAAAWSPDGMKIAFARGSNNTADIYVMNTDGSGVTNLTNNPLRYDVFMQPFWSPDSSKILFGAWDSTFTTVGVYVVEAAADQKPQMLYRAQNGDGYPAWSPDGSKIAFSSALDIYILGIPE